MSNRVVLDPRTHALSPHSRRKRSVDQCGRPKRGKERRAPLAGIVGTMFSFRRPVANPARCQVAPDRATANTVCIAVAGAALAAQAPVSSLEL